jgi:hypothetical protein
MERTRTFPAVGIKHQNLFDNTALTLRSTFVKIRTVDTNLTQTLTAAANGLLRVPAVAIGT